MMFFENLQLSLMECDLDIPVVSGLYVEGETAVFHLQTMIPRENL